MTSFRAKLRARRCGGAARRSTRDLCLAIATFAFAVSLFPLVLSVLPGGEDLFHASVIDPLDVETFVFYRARIAVGSRFAMRLFGSEDLAIRFAAHLRHDIGCIVFVSKVLHLHCDLKGVEELARSAMVDARGADGVNDPGERDLDGAGIFKQRDLDGLIGVVSWRIGHAVDGGMEIAEGHTAEGGGMAPGPTGFDMTAFVIHDYFSPDTPLPYSGGKFLSFSGLCGACFGKFF